MASLFTFKNAGKIFKALKSDNTSKRPRQLCVEAGSTLARIDCVCIRESNVRKLQHTKNYFL